MGVLHFNQIYLEMENRVLTESLQSAAVELVAKYKQPLLLPSMRMQFWMIFFFIIII